ncbi:MAG: IclR family transcriptional regulator [Nostocoides sp.]
MSPRKASSLIGGETSQTLDRGIRLIELLALPENGHGLTITELAQELGIGRAMVYRLVATLGERDYLRRDSSGRVRLGLGLARIHQALVPMLADWATPVLRDLANALSATAHLTIADSAGARAVAVVEPESTTFHMAYRAGSHHPLELGAAGRAILAGREGRDDLVFSQGELQTSAYGAAMSVRANGPVEASVGVVSLNPLNAPGVEVEIRAAATRLADLLDPRPA